MNQMKAGAILSYLSIFITIGIALLYTPVLIRLLGQEEYGLYMLIGSVAAYLSVLDLGLGNAIVRYTARNRAIGDKEAESKLNGMFLVLYSVIGVLTIIVGSVLYSTIDNIFGANLSETEIEKAKLMVIILVINFALSFPLSVFGSIMQAYERFVVTKLVGIIRSLLVPLVTVPLLLLGYGSVTMVLITSLVNIACLLFNVFYCFKKLKVRFYFGKMDFGLLREILGYSFLVFLGIIVDQVNWNTGQLILGAFSGTATVAIFAIALQFARLYMQFSTAISGMLLPRATIMVTNQVSNDELSRVMIKVGRIQYVVLAYILSGFILYGYAFIGFWAGQDYTQAYYVSLIIMIPITIPLIQNFGIAVLQAKGMQGFRSIVLIGIALLNVMISIFLVKDYGGIGVALGTGVSYAIGNALIMNIYYHKRIGLNIPLFWKNIMLMSIPIILSIFAGYGLNYLISQDGILLLLVNILFFTIIYASFIWFLGLNRIEKDLFSSIVKKIMKPLFKKTLKKDVT